MVYQISLKTNVEERKRMQESFHDLHKIFTMTIHAYETKHASQMFKIYHSTLFLVKLIEEFEQLSHFELCRGRRLCLR